ncbi:MAG: hypothetical protein IT249_04100 [Chitinophagaceae bacterium]|nr:hypothetical protein [Chitinophagaceae bacterium]
MLPLHKKVKKATSTPKGKIIFSAILLSIAGAIALSVIYWNTIKKTFIREKVSAAVQDKSDRLYSIHYDDMELNEVDGFLFIKNLSLNYDTAKYKALQNKDIPGTLFRLTVPSIKVTGVQTPQALLTKEIIGRKVEIKEPVIDIIYTRKGDDSTKGIPANEVYRQILGNLQLIKVDTFLVTGAKIITRDLTTGEQKLLLMDTHLELRDVAIDSVSNKDTSRLLFSKHLLVNCSKLSWTSRDKLYRYSLDSIILNSDDHHISTKSFKIIPQLDEIKFAQRKVYQADRYDIALHDIEIEKINFPDLLKEKIYAESITIRNSSIKIYRDMTRKPDGKSRIGTYPQQRVAQIPVSVTVEKLILKNSYVEYKERGRLMQKIGKVIFADLNGTFLNITNEKSAGKQDVLTADINANFLHRYPVKTTWNFYLNNRRGRFDVAGQLGSLDATGLNQLLEPLGGVKINKGRINQLSFHLKADNYSMKGPVKFLYNGLKVSVLKKDEETKELKKNKLVSMGANMLIYDDNPTKNKPVRIGEADFKRDTTRSMFHMCWKTLMEGIKSSAIKN